VNKPTPPDRTPDDLGADATYWGRYKGRWRQCFVLMFVIGFVVITIERIGEVHNATNAARLVLDALVGGVGDGLLLGSVLCLVAAIPKPRRAAR
jgi:predicted histidine transporter YuiF (NhaC family)